MIEKPPFVFYVFSLLLVATSLGLIPPVHARSSQRPTHLAYLPDFIAPLPPPRPRGLKPPAAPPPALVTAPSAPQQEHAAVEPDPACTRVLASAKLVAASIPSITGENGCGIADPVKLSAIVLEDGSHVALEPPAMIRCALAESIGDWIREDIAPLAQKAGGGLVKIIGSEGYECRPRNRIPGAKLSEHGKGNAYDMLGFTLHDGHQVLIANQAEDHELKMQLKTASCTRFMTVLGPGSDSFHETHLHVDLAERHNNYRLCQWEVK